MASHGTSHEIRFGEYSLDVRTCELRRNGALVHLQPQPAKVLAVLAGRPGEVVTRQELAEQVWGSETYVDFEHGLNYAIQQIRSVLEDDPKAPRFVETVPKRGYRFVAPLIASPEPQTGILPGSPQPTTSTTSRWLLPYFVGAAIVLAIAGYFAWRNLRSSNSARSPVGIKSVAVLPLRNLSSDSEQEYFSDGMTDELITDLAKSGSLRVISHTSVERFKNTKTPLPEIAKQLGVEAIVEGTVMRSGNNVRVTAQLIDARSDQHLWADSYDRDLRDVFALQDEVARRIANEIGANLNANQQGPRTHPLQPSVHEAYLRGNFYWNQLSCDGFRKAQQYFEQAVEADPNFARGYVGLAETDFTLADWGCSSDSSLISQSRQAAQKALDLDPQLGEAHAWLGKIAFFYEWNIPKAETELKQAVELSPNYPEAHMIYSVLLVTTGREEAGLAEMRKAREIDPISQLPNVIAVVAFYLARHYDDALSKARRRSNSIRDRPQPTTGWNMPTRSGG